MQLAYILCQPETISDVQPPTLFAGHDFPAGSFLNAPAYASLMNSLLFFGSLRVNATSGHATLLPDIHRQVNKDINKQAK
jgi:hypothetical protein